MKCEMPVFYFPGKQSMLGNTCVEWAEVTFCRCVQAACLATRHLFPKHWSGFFRSQCHGQIYAIKATEFLLEILQRDNPHTVSSTCHALKVCPANGSNRCMRLALIWNDGESLTYVSQRNGPTTDTPYSPSSVSQQFQSAIWWQTQLLPSVQICLVTNIAASSHLFLGEIVKCRYLCL